MRDLKKRATLYGAGGWGEVGRNTAKTSNTLNTVESADLYMYLLCTIKLLVD